MNELAAFMTPVSSVSTDSISAQLFRGFADPEYRAAYADETLNTAVSFQIRAIREQRDWTQQQLGEICGKAQGWISTLEDPNYGRFSLSTLRTLAKAFDCILEVRFRSFFEYSKDQDARRSGDNRVNSYDEDTARDDVAAAKKLSDILAATVQLVI